MTTIKTVKFLFISTVAILCTCGSVIAQANNSISGFVFSSKRNPIANVSVELLDEFHRLISRVKTQDSGRYIFSRVPQGRYFVMVSSLSSEYEESTKEIEIVNITRQSGSTTAVSASENVQLDFYLRNKRTLNPTTSNNVVFAQEIPQEAQKHYKNGLDKLKENKQKEGMEEILKAIAIFPQYYLALEKLSQEFIKQGNYKISFDFANKAVEVNPKSYESWYAIGYSAYQLKKFEEAVKALNIAISLNQSSVNALFLIGVNLRQVGKFLEAKENLIKAKKVADKPIPEIHWQLALLYTNDLKKYSLAADELELFLKATKNYQETEKVKKLIKTLRTKEDSYK
jgi:tetratricopeptide (TPR) repeat protein